MAMYRSWAFWRRFQYSMLFFVLLFFVAGGIYTTYIYQPPTCFDGKHNGSERGIDCGGKCLLVCTFDVTQPAVKWARSFKITDGFYNAVAYVENKNLDVGTPRFEYTFSLFDKDGDLITTRAGNSFLPSDSVYPVFEGRIAVGNKIPVRTFLSIEPINNWQETRVGRDEFIVSERELSGVDNKPRLDTKIKNLLLEDEIDVEIVATIFDKNGNALTASRSVVPLLQAREERSVIFTWPEPIAKTIRSCEVPSDVVLAIDLSGSMNDDSDDPPEPISSVLRSASLFVDRLKDNDQAAVVTFATFAELVQELSIQKTIVKSVIDDLTITRAEEVGSTNTGDALLFTGQEFQSPRHNRNARKVLVLLTDGLANAPGENAEEYALSAAEQLKEDDVTLFTIGLGGSVNQDFLIDMATEKENAFFAVDASTLDVIYNRISSALCENGPAVIDIIPKTRGSMDISL